MASRTSPKTKLLYTESHIQVADSTALLHHRPGGGQGAQLNAQASNVQRDRCTGAVAGKNRERNRSSTAVIYEGLIQPERSGKIARAPQEHWCVRIEKKIKKKKQAQGKKKHQTELHKRECLVDKQMSGVSRSAERCGGGDWEEWGNVGEGRGICDVEVA